MQVQRKTGDAKRQEFERAFLSTLMLDADAAIRRFRDPANDVQQARRELIRSVHATIDGVVWAFREHVRSSAHAMDLLTAAEEAVLAETNFRVSERGTISAQTRHIPLLGAVRLAARIATKIDPMFTADFGGTEWQDFCSAVATRNRVTHPKTFADLEVSAAEVDQVLSSFFWILELAVGAMESSVNVLRDFALNLGDVAKGLTEGNAEILQAYHQVIRDAQ